jgi:hypothetical protein
MTRRTGGHTPRGLLAGEEHGELELPASIRVDQHVDHASISRGLKNQAPVKVSRLRPRGSLMVPKNTRLHQICVSNTAVAAELELFPTKPKPNDCPQQLEALHTIALAESACSLSTFKPSLSLKVVQEYEACQSVSECWWRHMSTVLAEAAKIKGVSDDVWTVSAINRRTFGLTIACIRVKPRREARLEATVPSETRVELFV